MRNIFSESKETMIISAEKKYTNLIKALNKLTYERNKA
jgi:hypothetical protein